MHILVDARTTGPADLIRLSYAKNWALLWRTYHPHDSITFALSEGTTVEGHPMIHIRSGWSLFGKKKVAHHQHGPDRIISFSRLEPLDIRIPTLTHIFDSVDLLYPREVVGIFGKKKNDILAKNLLKKSHQLIVPHIEIGMELVEMFDVGEEKISVIPYMIPTREHHPFTLLHSYGVTPGYWIVEGSAGEEWDPWHLLQAYSRYIHDYNGTKKLIITGDLGNSLRHISECIRTLHLMEYVKILGIIPESDRSALYEYASGWIALGGYYGGGPSISYALSYGLPILASDIAPIRDYSDLTVHPNHTDEFAEKLLLLSKLHTGTEKYTHSTHAVMDVYARILAESTCK